MVADDDRYVTRTDFERALRNLNIADLELRDLVLKLAAQVVTLTDELTRRLDHGAPATATVDAAVDQAVGETVTQIRAADDGGSRVGFDLADGYKYAVEPADIPCAELIPLCRARCCTFVFALSTQDLDEGVIRFDYGQPYMIRQRSDGYCGHCEPTTLGCTVHAQRPRTCRTYDCRNDKRVWIDFEKRIPAPQHHGVEPDRAFDLHERVRLRGLAVFRERMAIDYTYPDGTPKR